MHLPKDANLLSRGRAASKLDEEEVKPKPIARTGWLQNECYCDKNT
jgi:hypothetical protein